MFLSKKYFFFIIFFIHINSMDLENFKTPLLKEQFTETIINAFNKGDYALVQSAINEFKDDENFKNICSGLLKFFLEKKDIFFINLLLMNGIKINFSDIKSIKILNYNDLILKRFLEHIFQKDKIINQFIINANLTGLINQYTLDIDKVDTKNLDLRTDCDRRLDCFLPCGCCCFCWIIGGCFCEKINNEWKAKGAFVFVNLTTMIKENNEGKFILSINNFLCAILFCYSRCIVSWTITICRWLGANRYGFYGYIKRSCIDKF